MKKDTSKLSQCFVLSLYWGSIWGLGEATLGHFLHIIVLPGLAGFVMFPLGLWIMIQVFNCSGRRISILTTALVASSIKLLDLALPSPTPLAVINPAVAILIESLAAIALLPSQSRSGAPLRLPRLAGLVLSWRVFYGLALGSLGLLFSFSSFFDLGWERLLYFFGLESFVNSVLLFCMFRISFFRMTEIPERKLRCQWSSIPILLFLAAAVIEFLT